MQENERKLSAQERKEKIRNRYKGMDTSDIEVIPAKAPEVYDDFSVVRRVAAYVRVSTDNDEQTSSYELQKNYYEEYINAQPNWEMAGIYDDEGISGTSITHRKGMQQLIEDCEAGKIDMVITKSIARFARNIVDCLSIVEKLKKLNVGVRFEAENIYTLDTNGRMILTILSSVAEEESHSKSIIMNWSIDKRFSRGLFLTPELLGYDRDDEGNLVINPEEAETVKVIYYLYLNGFSPKDIAELLNEYGRKSKLGNVNWNSAGVMGVIRNERHCGDILARKTYTPDFLDHKAKKNTGQRTMYRKQNHHDEIVSREVYNAANHLRASRKLSKCRRLPILSVVEGGILRGFVPCDKDWTGFSADEYMMASESVFSETEDVEDRTRIERRLDLSGYQIVRAQLFSTPQNPAMSISKGKLSFNVACLKKFEDVEYVELLLNSVSRCVAIRPCAANNPNAIRWGALKNDRWASRQVSCRGLAQTLFNMLDWDDDIKYRFRGDFITDGEQKMMLFELDEPEMIKSIELPPVEPTASSTEDKVVESSEAVESVENTTAENTEDKNTDKTAAKPVKTSILIFPEKWENRYGRPVGCLARVHMLEQKHYAGDWDVLCSAKEVEDLNVFTVEGLEALLHEAENIIEGWIA